MITSCPSRTPPSSRGSLRMRVMERALRSQKQESHLLRIDTNIGPIRCDAVKSPFPQTLRDPIPVVRRRHLRIHSEACLVPMLARGLGSHTTDKTSLHLDTQDTSRHAIDRHALDSKESRRDGNASLLGRTLCDMLKCAVVW